MRILVIIAFLAMPLLSSNASENIAQIGEFNTSSTVAELLGLTSAQSFEQVIPGDKSIEWAVYVPGNYDSEIPAGILVFISAGNSGKIPNQWKKIMDRYNLIWIGANRSGNKKATSLRVIYAILAPALINKNYNVNADRVYISGFSGGGRVSSMVATEYAHIFKGAIYNSGANFWGKEKPKRYDEIKNNHYVFITGTKDFNRRDTKKVYNTYKRAGVQNIKLMVIPSMSHENPRMSKYEEAINFLDSRVAN
jgi:predicted peptidase